MRNLYTFRTIFAYSLLSLSITLIFISATSLYGQEIIELNKLYRTDISDPYAGEFGWCINIDQDIAIIGSPTGGANHINSGTALIFYFNSDTQSWQEIKRIFPADGMPGDYFGASVDISNQTVVIGSYFDNDNGLRSGCAYIYNRNQGGIDNWGFVAKVLAPDGEIDDEFGKSVSIFQDHLVVGSDLEDSMGAASGAVYIYGKNVGGTDNWGFVKKIIPNDLQGGDRFGYAVDNFEDYILVGAPYSDENGGGSGNAYLFGKDTGGIENWGQIKEITPFDGYVLDYFGTSVSIDDGLIIVGAYGNDIVGSESGTAYIFEQNYGGTDNWGERTRLTPADGSSNDNFGKTVQMSGQHVIVGSQKDDDNGSNSGSSYIFSKDFGGVNNWGQLNKILPSQGTDSERFGSVVSIHEDHVLVGAFGDGILESDIGKVYSFNINAGNTGNLNSHQIITADKVSAFDEYGRDLAIDGNYAVVGAYLDDDLADKCGSAFIFKRDVNDNWVMIKKLLPPIGYKQGYFGLYVDISGDNVAISSVNDDVGADRGAAYIFRKDKGGIENWGLVKRITAIEGGNQFGSTIGISDDVVVVGTLRSNKAYVYHKNLGGPENWGGIKTLTVSGTEAPDYFTPSVSIDNKTIIVSAKDLISDESKLIVFHRDFGGIDNWGIVKQLLPSDLPLGGSFVARASISGNNFAVSNGTAVNIFNKDFGGNNNWGLIKSLDEVATFYGSSLSMDEDYLVVGAFGDSVLGNQSGSSFIYHVNKGGLNNWGQVKKLIPSDGEIEDRFGIDVGISYNNIIVGAYWDDNDGTNSGTVYHYKITSCLDNFVQTNNSILNQSVLVEEFIETNGIIPVGTMIDLQAQDYILMNEQFEVDYGAVFHAYISPCL